MKPEQYAALLSEDIRQNNGFLVELTISELLILEGLAPTEAEAIQHIKKLIKKTYYDLGAIRQPDDAANIINYLREKFSILDLTDPKIIEEIVSFIHSGNKTPNYAGDKNKVSKYIVKRGDAERRAQQIAYIQRRDDKLDR